MRYQFILINRGATDPDIKARVNKKMERKKLVKMVRSAQNGDHKAVDALFNAYYNDVYYFALKTVKDEETACEVTQDTFVSILKNLKDLKEPAAFVTWMKQIAYNHCARFFQKKKEVLVDADEEGNTVFDAVPEERTEFVPDEALDQEDFRRTILGMLDELSPEQRSATMLYYYSEMSVKQIAQIQSVSEGTVKSRLNYARKAIKKSVEDYEKKNDVKLHSVALLPLLFWMFAGAKAEMSAAAVPVMVGEIFSATGIALTAGSTGSTAAGAAAASTGGLAAKLAGVPLATKIIAGVASISLTIGGIGAAIMHSNQKSPEVTDPICQHQWVDADCKVPKTCSLCGATEGGALGHTWIGANCEAPKTCAVCSQTEGEALGHSWTDANCEAPKTCAVCGKTDGEALGHTWTDANYQAPKICSVCNTADGEPLTPDFEKLGIDVITAEMGVEYDYFATCSENTSKTTVGKVVFSSHYILDSDEKHEAADGYQWHILEYTITFNDDNAWDYGTSVRTGYANYYRTGTSFDHSNADTKHFSVNYNGVERDQCMIQKGDIHYDGWVGRTCTFTCNTSWRVPSGYDGYIFILYDYFTEWEEGQHFYEFMDENTLYFRFDNSTAQEPGTDIPEQSDTTITEPSVPEPPVSEPPVTEPPVEKPPVTEPEVTAYFVPDGCTYIMADGTELKSGEAMPKNCTNGDKFITEAYTYVFGREYGEGEFFDNDGNFLGVGVGFINTGIDGWSVIVKDKAQNSYPALQDEINGELLVSLQNAFNSCKNMTQAPVIPDSVTNLSETFSDCYSLAVTPAIPEGVTRMFSTFSGCAALKTAPILPNTVTSLSCTFAGCTSLKSAPKIPSSVLYMDHAFMGCTSVTRAPELPDGIRDLCATFQGSGLQIAPEIPAKVTNLGYAFAGTAITTAPQIPVGVTNMNNTFADCTFLTEAPVIPETVTEMYCTFSGCTSLITAPEIPSGVTSIRETFRDCTVLTTAPTIPETVTDMYSTFSGCTALIGKIEINATLSDGLLYCFEGTVKPIVLTGSCDNLAELAATAENGNVTVG